MNLRSLIIITSCLFAVGLTSCQKKDTTVATAEDVRISITSPQEGNVYKTSDTVSIAATINSNNQLHGYIVRVKEVSTEKILYETEGHAHDGNLTVKEYWVNTLTYNADLVLELIAVIEHDENTKNAKVGFKSQP